MFQSASAPARGSRSKRLGRPSNRSGIQKRNGGPIRVDKDGDLDMDATGVISKGRNGENNGNRDALRIRGTSGPGSSRDPKAPRSTRTGLNATAVQKAILRGMGSAQDLPRGRASTRLMRPMGREGLSQIIVRGFKNSKAASNPDGGIKDLLGFLERKASAPDASAREMVRITKVCLTPCIPGTGDTANIRPI